VTERESIEVTYSESLKLCAYGKWGVRKTQAIASLTHEFGKENVAVVNCEGGLGTIESSVLEKNVIRCHSLQDIRQAWKRCNAEFNTPEHWVCLDGMSAVMKWVGNDQWKGADELYDQLVQGRKLEDIEERLRPFGRFITNRNEIDPQKVYGKIGRESEILLAAWITLKSNIYANYLEDMCGTSGREKTVPWGPDVPGKVGLAAVMSKFDYIMRFTYDKDGRLVAGLDPASNLYLSRTRDDRNKTGKTLPKEIVDFDLAKFIVEYLNKEK